MQRILKVTLLEDNTPVYLNADLIRGVLCSQGKKSSVILFNSERACLDVVEDVKVILRRLSKLYPDF